MIKHERDWWIVEYDDYGNTGCRVFKIELQNKKDFCLKINVPEGHYWILQYSVVASCQTLGIILVIKWFKIDVKVVILWW